MHADSLSADLHDHLHWWLREAPPGPCRWVMDWSWFAECRKIGIDIGHWILPPPELLLPETLLGLPIDIRERDDDRPGWMWRVPHLERAS